MEKGFVVWYTGVAASGKSTIGKEVVRRLRERGIKIEDFDADEVRANISPNLGFTLEARDENTKRLAFFGSILARNSIGASIAAVSSLRRFRDRARSMIDNFAEVYVKCPLEECKRRDPKGLYKKGEEGKAVKVERKDEVSDITSSWVECPEKRRKNRDQDDDRFGELVGEYR